MASCRDSCVTALSCESFCLSLDRDIWYGYDFDCLCCYASLWISVELKISFDSGFPPLMHPAWNHFWVKWLGWWVFSVILFAVYVPCTIVRMCNSRSPKVYIQVKIRLKAFWFRPLIIYAFFSIWYCGWI